MFLISTLLGKECPFSLKGIVHPKMKNQLLTLNVKALYRQQHNCMFKAQKGSKDIIKIFHVTSVVQP